MSPINLTYWLAGFIELNGTEDGLTAEQLKIVEKHLQLVLKNVTKEPVSTPEISGPYWIPTVNSPYLNAEPLCMEEPTITISSTDASQNSEMAKSWTYVPALEMHLTC